MAYKMFKYTSREEWLALRHQDVTASAIGALFGCHPYQTMLGLYAEKIKPKPEPKADNAIFRRGRWLEAAAIKGARELRPNWEISEPGAYFRDEDNRVGATPDAFFVNEDGECGVLQIKSVARSVFKKDWHEGEQLIIPYWITLQSYVEARLAGFYKAAVGALVSDEWTTDLEIIEFDCPEAPWPRIVKEARRFWQMVERRQQPPAEYEKDLDALQDLYTGNGSAIDLTGDESFGKLLDERDAIHARRDQAVEDSKIIKAKIIQAMKDSEAAVHGGRLVTFKEQSRKSYTVAPTNFRVLRVGDRPKSGAKK